MNAEFSDDPLLSAERHAGLGLPLPAGVRLSFAKRFVARAARFFIDPQRAYNLGLVNSVHELRAEVEDARATAHRQADDSEKRIGELCDVILQLQTTTSQQAHHQEGRTAELWSGLIDFQLSLAAGETAAALIEGQVVGVNGDVRRLENRMSLVDDAISRMSDALAARRQRERMQQSLVDLFLREVRRAYPAAPDRESLAALPGLGDDLYEALEDTFRGSFDDVQDRLRVYLADIRGVSPGGRVLDIGTGRGEWLELLAQAGISAYGVDTNASAVERCHARGLEVLHADALRHIASAPDGSLAVITGFQFAEHIPFPALLDLIDHAARVLQPGGLFILETPNPANLIVGSASFYLDPTHERPLHPMFLQFLLAARGFSDVELRYLNPNTSPLEWSPELEDIAVKPLQPIVERLNHILFGPQDFAVLGRRGGS